jgi:hypothetical protein
LIVALRCAVCGRGFSVEIYDLLLTLKDLQRRQAAPGGLFALTCSECGAKGRSWKDGVLVRLGDPLRPLFGPATEKEGGE